jgi:hypothetical protein
MSAIKFSKPSLSKDPATAIRRAAKYLLTQGYEQEKEDLLVYEKGSRQAFRLDEQRHHVHITHDGANLELEFYVGLKGSGMVITSERAVLEAKAEAAARAAEEVPARIGCKLCGQLTASTGARCESCGAPDFA